MAQSVEEFLKSGGLIQRSAYKEPRQSEKTWRSNVGSVSHIGAKAATLLESGINRRKLG